jgi:hypothetical protein
MIRDVSAALRLAEDIVKFTGFTSDQFYESNKHAYNSANRVDDNDDEVLCCPPDNFLSGEESEWGEIENLKQTEFEYYDY